MKTDRLRNDRLLEQSESRSHLFSLGSIVASVIVLLVLSALFTVRRSHREVSEANDMLTYTAKHDALTGLANRASFRTMLQEALEAQRIGGTSCALFLIDLDRFKEVNDTLGHAGGDLLLCSVASRARDLMDPRDQVCRLGGGRIRRGHPLHGRSWRTRGAS